MTLERDSALLLAAVVHGGLLSVLLWTGRAPDVSPPAARRSQRVANRCLAALTVVAALRLIPYALGYAGAYDERPGLMFAPFDLTLALGPLLWGYVTALTTGALPPRWRWHLVPAAVQAGYYAVCFALPPAAMWAWSYGGHFPIVEPVGLGAILLSVGAYTAAAWRRYAAHQGWLTDNLSNREEFRLPWLRTVLLAVASTWTVTAGYYLVARAGHPLGRFDRGPAVVWLAGLVYALGLAGWRYGARPLPLVEPEDLEPAVATAPIGREARGPGFDGAAVHAAAALGDGESASDLNDAPAEQPAATPQAEYARLAAVWAADVARTGVWRDPLLTRAVLARHLGVSPRTLSRVLNEGLGQSFHEFVNRRRAEYVADRLRKAAGRDVGAHDESEQDLLALAFEAGFNSKASFNRAFKAYVGLTPSAFRARESAARRGGAGDGAEDPARLTSRQTAATSRPATQPGAG